MPQELQICLKVLQMHVPGGKGAAIVATYQHPKNCKILKTNIYYCLVDVSLTNTFDQGGHCAQRAANLLKSAANAPSRGWGGSPCCNLTAS